VMRLGLMVYSQLVTKKGLSAKETPHGCTVDTGHVTQPLCSCFFTGLVLRLQGGWEEPCACPTKGPRVGGFFLA
jgi:hypothetical protein